MGISGLLKFVKDATESIHIKKYAGQAVAVDTYCWIHRGSFACAEKLAKNENTDQYVRYCMKYIDMLESFHVKPILVFDGCRLPSKELVEQERHRRRKENMERGKQMLREGKLTAARDCFTKCISVTPAMALRVIEAARARGVDCVVAPYEADAQLAYFAKANIVQAVVTEDSDLLCFGCERVVFKMDLTGRAQEVTVSNLGRVKNISGFTPDLFRHMCILSGCDYLPSIKGVGLVKACKALKLSKSKDSYQVASRLHQYIKGLSPIDPVYGKEFIRADKTFLYQLVFDPRQRKLKPLNDYPEAVDVKDVEFAGPYFSDEKAFQIALGNIDINTQAVIGYFDIDTWIFNRKPVDNLPSVWGDPSNGKQPLRQSNRKKIISLPKDKGDTEENKPEELSAADVLHAVVNGPTNTKDEVQSPKVARTSPPKDPAKKVIGCDIKDLLQTYGVPARKKTSPNSGDKNTAKVVKSRFFAPSRTSGTPQEFDNTSGDSFNHSDSLFSDRKSAEDSVLSDILSEMTARSMNSSSSLKRNAAETIDSSSKRKKTVMSSGEALERLSCRKKRKKLNLHTEAPLTVSEERCCAPKDENDEAIPLLDDSSALLSLLDGSVAKSPPTGNSPTSRGEESDQVECDESIPILDDDLSPKRIPLSAITNDNVICLDSPEKQLSDHEPIVVSDESEAKCHNRRLGLPSAGRFNKSPVKLNLSKYFVGSKASGLRKIARKSARRQPSIKSFFLAKS